MSEFEFNEIDGNAAVYEIENDRHYHTGVIQNARSQFAEDYDVDYADVRGQMTEYHGEKVVLVGEIK